MSKCEYYVDGFCTNADCSLRAEFCIFEDKAEDCRYAKINTFENKIKNAICHFKYGIDCDIFQEPVTSYAKTAVSALEKQIPKKPNIHGYREGREINTISYTCPICNKHIGREDFCKHCGQALDWSDTE